MNPQKVTWIVHWPGAFGKDVPVCDTHRLQHIGMAKAMGFKVRTTPVTSTNADCQNCVEEKGEGVQQKAVDAQKIRKLEVLARNLATLLNDGAEGAFKRKELGFALFVFSFEGAELTYISNAARDTMIKTLAEFIGANPPAMTWDEQHG